MWHIHKWEDTDKRLTEKVFTRAGFLCRPSEFKIECVATLSKCSKCGKEKAQINPTNKDYWLQDFRLCGFFGEMDPFVYREKFGINKP